MRVFILSAGLGTRLRPLTYRIPKVLVKIGGKPILEHLLNLCRRHDFRDIIVNLHHLPEKVVNYFQNGKKWGVRIRYSYEKKLLGGAGALKKVQNYLKKTFFVINGDLMTDLNLTKMADFHFKKKGLGCFFVHKTDHPYDSDLVEFGKNNLITNFFRPSKGDKFKPFSKSGVHIFEPEILKYIPENKEYSLEKDLIPKMLKQKAKFFAFYSDDYAKDMGTWERLKEVRKDFAEGKIKI